MKSSKLERLSIYLIVACGGTLMIVPFLWMLSTSLKTTVQSMAFPPEWWPQPFVWENYIRIYEHMPFFTFLFNSSKIVFFVLIGQLATCSMAGYAFAKLRFPGRKALFLILLSTMMIPAEVTLIPVFVIMKYLGWINTHYALIVPAFFGSVFGTFLLRQFFLGLPNDLEDAARIDGCSPFGIYWRIMLPLAKPSLATLAIFTFMGTWNDFMRPLNLPQRHGQDDSAGRPGPARQSPGHPHPANHGRRHAQPASDPHPLRLRAEILRAGNSPDGDERVNLAPIPSVHPGGHAAPSDLLAGARAQKYTHCFIRAPNPPF